MDFRFSVTDLLISEYSVFVLFLGILGGTTGFFVFEKEQTRFTFLRRNFLGIAWGFFVFIIAAVYWKENEALKLEDAISRWQVIFIIIAGAIVTDDALMLLRNKALKRFGNGNGKKEKDD